MKMSESREILAGQRRLGIRGALIRTGLATETFEERFQSDRCLTGPGTLRVGRWTYWSKECRFATFCKEDLITVGSFCSFASRVNVVAGGEHGLTSVAGYPLPLMDWRPGAAVPQTSVAATIAIGSDVWVATAATILGGVRIGDGSVIAAGSVVVDDVSPYTIVAGVPARPIRSRFEPEVITLLLEARWWEWPDTVIKEARATLMREDIDAFQALAERVRFAADRQTTMIDGG